jgi:hypothetical protein
VDLAAEWHPFSVYIFWEFHYYSIGWEGDSEAFSGCACCLEAQLALLFEVGGFSSRYLINDIAVVLGYECIS